MQKETVAKRIKKVLLEKLERDLLEMMEARSEITRDDIITFIKEYAKDGLEAKESSTVTEDVWLQKRILFWSFEEIIPITEHLFFRNVTESDRSDFLRVTGEYSEFASMIAEESYSDEIWNDHINGKGIFLSIFFEDKYIGYCGVKDVTESQWEIAVELASQWTGRGLGSMILSKMLNTMKERMGMTEYRIKIDPGNIPSQKMFERIGAIPNGISELWIHDEKELWQCEEENLDSIDDELIRVANKFNVEPRKLLSHVLEYKLSWTDQ